MKKILAVLLVITVAVGTFVGCSAKKNNNDQNGNPKAEAASSSAWADTTITTDTAKIAEGAAAALIASYSAKELNLSKEDKKNCSFMTRKTGVKIKDDYYVEVDAILKTEVGKDEKGHTKYTFDVKGQYFIRYDGQQVLKKNMDKDKYTELELKEVPTEKTTKE